MIEMWRTARFLTTPIHAIYIPILVDEDDVTADPIPKLPMWRGEMIEIAIAFMCPTNSKCFLFLALRLLDSYEASSRLMDGLMP